MGAPGQFGVGRFSSRQERQEAKDAKKKNLKMVFLALSAPWRSWRKAERGSGSDIASSIRKHPARPSPPMHLPKKRLLIGFIATRHQDLEFSRKRHGARQILKAQCFRGRRLSWCFFHG